MEWMNLDNGNVGYIAHDELRVLKCGDTLVEELSARIQEDYPDAWDALKKEYAKSKENKRFYEFKIVKRFLRCNMGAYDTTCEDMDRDGCWNLEVVACPLRGECKLENVVCRAKKKSCLSKREEEVLLLASRGMNAKGIADALFIAEPTIHHHINHILRKLVAKNMKEAIMIYTKSM